MQYITGDICITVRLYISTRCLKRRGWKRFSILDPRLSPSEARYFRRHPYLANACSLGRWQCTVPYPCVGLASSTMHRYGRVICAECVTTLQECSDVPDCALCKPEGAVTSLGDHVGHEGVRSAKRERERQTIMEKGHGWTIRIGMYLLKERS